MAQGDPSRREDSRVVGKVARFGTGCLATAALAISLGVAVIVAVGAARWWGFELLSHFREAHALATAAVVGLLLVARRWRTALAGAVLVGWLAVPMAPYFGDPPGAGAPADAGGEELVVMLANLNAGNEDVAAVLAAIREASPDLLLLMEVTPTWRSALDELAAGFPWRLERPRPDAFGIWLLSKRPLEEARILEAPAGVPSIEATWVGKSGARLRLLATHPVPPIGGSGAARRDRQLAWCAEWAAAPADRRVAVLGDLNCTPFSPRFRELLAAGRLRDSAAGYGLPATWRPGLPGLGIPIDHLLVGEGVRVLERRVGPPIGSDHLPVVARIALGPGPGDRAGAESPVEDPVEGR